MIQVNPHFIAPGIDLDHCFLHLYLNIFIVNQQVMKLFGLISMLLILFTIATGHCQKIKTYKVWVTLINESKVKGILYEANEDGLLLMDTKLKDTIAFLDCRNIEQFKVRKKGNVGKGAGIGALGGATIGAIIGFADGDDDPGILSMTAEEKALGGGIALAIPGAGIGALIGTGSKKYFIHGAKGTYLAILPEVKTYTLQ